MGEINQKLTQTSLSQTLNSHSESIDKIKAQEEEPSPIYWPPQQQSQQEQYTPQFFAEMEARMDTHFEQIMSHLNREEEELQRQSMANLDGQYMVDENNFFHEQTMTTIKNREVVETHVEEMKEEKIEDPQALQRAKGEEVSIEAPLSSTLILETPPLLLVICQEVKIVVC
jgi:nicotinic acid phosphoribosyltransferase